MPDAEPVFEFVAGAGKEPVARVATRKLRTEITDCGDFEVAVGAVIPK